jgi:hypothetical protein
MAKDTNLNRSDETVEPVGDPFLPELEENDAAASQYFSRSEEDQLTAQAAWADEEARRQQTRQTVYEFNIPMGGSITPEKMAELMHLMRTMGMIAGDDIPEDARAMPAIFPQNQPLCYGLDIDDETMQAERKIELVDMVYTYIGVTPRPVDAYCGRWLKCLGVVLAPVTAEVTERDSITGEPIVDQITGEVATRAMTWQQPLVKLDAVDDVTDEHIILFGGGAAGKRFAMEMTKLFGPGDWARPRRLFISQEARQGVGKGGKLEPRRLFRFLSTAEKPEKAKDGKK